MSAPWRADFPLPEAALDPSLLWEELARDGERIALVVVDGLGGLPHPATGRTELEAARTPNLDALAAGSACGLSEPIGPGVTPGSGPAHLALFGYHPLRFRIGRGVLAALGSGFDLRPGDVAARINFATLGADGRVLDRRAGRIADALCAETCALLRERVTLAGDVDWFLEPVREHRAVLVLRGPGLSDALDDTDPQRTGRPPRPVRARTPAAEGTAELVRAFLDQAGAALAGRAPANGLLLRGFAAYRPLPGLRERFGLRGRAVAQYPMYRGLARLVGMEVAERAGDAAEVFERHFPAAWASGADLVFAHYKPTDSRGEDGDFDAKVAALEAFDGLLPRVLECEPAVLVVTGDHSTPATLGGHGWHPVPLAIRARHARVDRVERFDELACARGALGLRPALHVLGLALAHAGRLDKFGA